MNDQARSTKNPENQGIRDLAAMKVEAFLRWAGISRFLFYQEVKRGRIHPKKCGARTMIPVEEAERCPTASWRGWKRSSRQIRCSTKLRCPCAARG
jgi:hypothetical protein